MKMVMAVVPKEEASEVINELVAAGHTATFMESKGGALRQASQTLFVAVQEQDIAEVLDIINRYCYSCVSLERTNTTTEGLASPTHALAEVGGAVVFIWELEHFQRYRM